MGGVEVTALVTIVGMLGLALVALLRAERKDIPAVVRALAHWWRRQSERDVTRPHRLSGLWKLDLRGLG
jgi:hypothetical protein